MDVKCNFFEDDKPFDGFLHINNSKKLSKFDIDNKNYATKIKEEISSSSSKDLVLKVTKKEKKQPAKPFITSTLQQKRQENLGFRQKNNGNRSRIIYRYRSW